MRISLSGDVLPDAFAGIGPGCRVKVEVEFDLTAISTTPGQFEPRFDVSGDVSEIEVCSVVGPHGGCNPRVEAIKSMMKPDRLPIHSTGVMG